MNIVIIDDDKLTLIVLKKMLLEIPHIQIAGVFQSTKKAEDFLKYNKVDMIFVDIIMPEENGVNFAKRISEEFSSMDIVFLTSHKEYALEAFDIYAFDYIIKPISQERLEKTIKRAMKKRTFVATSKKQENTNRLFLYCLGGMDIRNTEETSMQLPYSKSEELLAYLLLNRGKSVSKWSIIDELFREMPRSNAETYLNTTTYRLRKALQQYGMKEAVVCAKGSYRIDIKNIYTDFIDFENRVNTMTTIDRTNIEEAINIENIYGGELFGHKAYHWSLLEKERLSLVYSSFSKQVSTKLMELGNYHLAVKILKKLENMDELDEEVNCLLMQVHAAQKDKLSLIRQYEKYAKILKKELGTKPEHATINLYEKLKKSL